jgi:hypothetical protein
MQKFAESPAKSTRQSKNNREKNRDIRPRTAKDQGQARGRGSFEPPAAQTLPEPHRGEAGAMPRAVANAPTKSPARFPPGRVYNFFRLRFMPRFT